MTTHKEGLLSTLTSDQLCNFIMSPFLKNAALAAASCLMAWSFSSSAKAAAIVDLKSKITVNAFFDAAVGPNGYVAFSDFNPPSFSQTFGFGQIALASANSTTDNGFFDPNGNFQTLSETLLDFDLLWTGPEFGLGFGSGYAETGFTINLANPGNVVFDFKPAINIKVSSDPFSFAFASFEYDARWNGQLINNFADNIFLLSVGGACQTIACAYANNQNFQIALPGIVGNNTFYIDPTFDSRTQQRVPGPLPILGLAAAFRSARKLRKLTSALKPH